MPRRPQRRDPSWVPGTRVPSLKPRTVPRGRHKAGCLKPRRLILTQVCRPQVHMRFHQLSQAPGGRAPPAALGDHPPRGCPGPGRRRPGRAAAWPSLLLHDRWPSRPQWARGGPGHAQGSPRGPRHRRVSTSIVPPRPFPTAANIRRPRGSGPSYASGDRFSSLHQRRRQGDYSLYLVLQCLLLL